MLSLGLIHGDLSEFNVLMAPDGPVIIDLPQVVNAAGNNAAFAMLERDTNNIRSTLGRFAPELLQTEFAREMWALYQQGELQPDSELTGIFRRDETAADADGVMRVIDDAREELALRAERAFDGRFAAQFPDVGAVLNHLDVEIEPVAGGDRVAKLGFVDAQEVHQAGGRIEGLGGIGQDAADLCQGFDDQNARHDRAMRKMSLTPGLVGAHHLVAANALAGHDVRHAIDHHEWIAMRQKTQQPLDVVTF